MDKNIKKYEQFIIKEVEGLKASNSKDNKIKYLYEFHQESVRNFQHERFIHLIVTLFFAGLLIISVMSLFILSSISSNSSNFTLLIMLISIICMILLITEIFYIKYYFELENGTQKLYKYSKVIFEMIINNQNK